MENIFHSKIFANIFMALLFLKKYREGIMRFIYLFFIFALAGCCMFSKTVNFTNETIPAAVVGKHYHAEIITKGLPLTSLSIENKKEYIINGLKVVVSETTGPQNMYIDINGVPIKEGVYSFWVFGSTVGTQCPGSDFKKKVTLVAVNPGP